MGLVMLLFESRPRDRRERRRATDPLVSALRRGVSVRPEMLVAEAEQVSRADHALSVRPTALPNHGAGGHLHEYSRFFFRNDDLSPDMSYEVVQDNSSRGSRRKSCESSQVAVRARALLSRTRRRAI